jgi:hypothetical protein
MTIRKSSLMAATASVALLAIPPTGAFAFDVVDWEFTDLVDKEIDVDITVNDTFTTTGVVQVEKLQMHFGNIDADATVYGVDNNPPGGDVNGLVVIDEIHNGGPTYEDLVANQEDSDNPINGPFEFSPELGSQLNVELVDRGGGDYGDVNEVNESLDFDVRVYGEIPIEALGGVTAAIDLPKVENAATAVSNNQDITSTVPTYLHDAQIAAGAINDLEGNCSECNAGDPLAFLIGAWLLTEVDDEFEGINVHTDIAALTILGAATGFIEPAEITATATVYDVNNATVENAATAVTNNMSVELAALTPNDAMMVADITQVGIANVSASATLRGNPCDGECGGDPAVEINGYVDFAGAGLGPLGNAEGVQTPIVSNVATAVGNNLSINVSGPDVNGGS